MKKRIAILSGAIAAAGLSAGLSAPSARANLLVDGGFETPIATSNASTLLPGTAALAAGNPTYPWYDLSLTGEAGGDGAYISSDIPLGNANISDRINSGTSAPAGGVTGSNGANPGTGPSGVANGYNAQSGDQYAYSYTAGQATGTVGGVGQLVTGITGGDMFDGKGYFLDKDYGAAGADGDRLHGTAPSSEDLLQLIFENSSGTALATFNSTTVLIGPGPGAQENVWTLLDTGAVVAPATATQVLFEFFQVRGGGGPGGVMFGDTGDLEDLTQNAIPEPASLGLVGSLALLTLRNRRRNV